MEAKKSKKQEELESMKSRISELEESLRVERLRNRLNEKIAPFETIKHQRDKQILIVHRASIQLFNLYEGLNTPPR